MRLTFTRLVNPRIRIVARTSQIPDMPEQVSLSILHPQIPELNPNREKSNRRLAAWSTARPAALLSEQTHAHSAPRRVFPATSARASVAAHHCR